VLIRKLVKQVDTKITSMEEFFEMVPKSMINIHLTRSQEEFQSFSGDKFPEWAQAIAFPKRKIIIIRSVSGEDFNRLPQVLLHELSHIFLEMRFPNTKIPTWLHEGISQKLSNDNLSMDEQVQIANALYSENLTELNALDSLFGFSRVKANLAYALARSAVDYFCGLYGDKNLLHIIDNISHKSSLDMAFKTTTDRDFIDFEVGWFAYLEEEYRWMILLNASNFIWFFLLLLFFAAFVRIKLKNQKTIDSWPKDDDPLTE